MVFVETMWCSAISEIVVHLLVSICFRIAHCRINCAFRPISPPLLPLLRTWCHENEKDQILRGRVLHAVVLTRSCDYRFSRCEFLLLTRDVKYTFAAKNKVDLIR